MQNRGGIISHDFVLVCAAQFIFGFGFQLLVPTLPIYLSKRGLNEVDIGILIGLFGLASVALRPLVGKGLARIAEKKFMVVAAFLNTVVSARYIIALSFWPLFALRIIQGTAFALHHTASMTLVANIGLPAHRAKTLGYFSLAMNIASASAPLRHDTHQSLRLYAPLSCLHGSRRASTHSESADRQKNLTQPTSPSGDDVFFLSRKAISPAITAALALFTWAALTAFFPLYAILQGVRNTGLFFTTMAIMLILCRGLGGKILDTVKKEKIIVASLVAPIIAMTILAFSKTMPMFVLVAAIWGIGHAFLMPSLTAYALDRVSSTGSALGTFTAVADIGLFVGPMVAGFLASYTSYPAMFGSIALLAALNLAFFCVFERKGY